MAMELLMFCGGLTSPFGGIRFVIRVLFIAIYGLAILYVYDFARGKVLCKQIRLDKNLQLCLLS